MILRRFMQHVREQNWFAVGLDVIVVIVGIFLGLQVQAAYEERADRAQEAIYLERLHSDLMDVLFAQEQQVFSRHDTVTRLSDIVDVVIYDKDDSILTPQHCRAIFLSNIYSTTLSSLPTMTELLASGQLSIISSQNLRYLISRYTLTNERNDDMVDNARSSRLSLIGKYPELVPIGPHPEAVNFTVTQLSMSCDYEAMKENQEFKNDLAGNLTRFGSLGAALRRQEEILQEMHDELDKILGITHAEDVS